MGTEAVWIPLVMAAAGTATSMYNTRRTERRQDNELANQLRNQTARQRRADSEVQKLIEQTAKSNPQDEIAASLAQYTEQLRRGAGLQGGALAGAEGASDTYQKDAAAANAGISQYGDKVAGLMSRIDGLTRSRENETVDRMDYQNRISLLGREGQGQDFLSRMRLDGIRPNAGLSALSEILSGAASTYGSGSKSAAAGSGGSGKKKGGKQ